MIQTLIGTNMEKRRATVVAESLHGRMPLSVAHDDQRVSGKPLGAMKRRVSPVWQQLQVLWTVVALVAVAMMHMFGPRQGAPKELLHDDPMREAISERAAAGGVMNQTVPAGLRHAAFPERMMWPSRAARAEKHMGAGPRAAGVIVNYLTLMTEEGGAAGRA